jgi:hypothetical protein
MVVIQAPANRNDEVNNPGTLLTVSDGSISRTNVDRSSLTITAGSLGRVTAADVAECVRKDQTAERMLPDFWANIFYLYWQLQLQRLSIPARSVRALQIHCLILHMVWTLPLSSDLSPFTTPAAAVCAADGTPLVQQPRPDPPKCNTMHHTCKPT